MATCGRDFPFGLHRDRRSFPTSLGRQVSNTLLPDLNDQTSDR